MTDQAAIRSRVFFLLLGFLVGGPALTSLVQHFGELQVEGKFAILILDSYREVFSLMFRAPKAIIGLISPNLALPAWMPDMMAISFVGSCYSASPEVELLRRRDGAVGFVTVLFSIIAMTISFVGIITLLFFSQLLDFFSGEKTYLNLILLSSILSFVLLTLVI